MPKSSTYREFLRARFERLIPHAMFVRQLTGATQLYEMIRQHLRDTGLRGAPTPLQLIGRRKRTVERLESHQQVTGRILMIHNVFERHIGHLIGRGGVHQRHNVGSCHLDHLVGVVKIHDIDPSSFRSIVDRGLDIGCAPPRSNCWSRRRSSAK